MHKHKYSVVAVIPARMGSSRFPGKPIELINGKPMIEYVFRTCEKCSDVNKTIIATCDEEIKEVSESFGAEVIMTSSKHERCTDRVAEAVQDIDAEIVVVMQGDEPMVTPDMISKAIRTLKDNPDVFTVNVISRIEDIAEINDPNEVKVVTSINNNALYFSRSGLPSFSKSQDKLNFSYKQICIIPMKKENLILFNQLEPTPLEEIESVDMLRVLEHGYKLKCVETSTQCYSVDTPADLEKVSGLMLNSVAKVNKQ